MVLKQISHNISVSTHPSLFDLTSSSMATYRAYPYRHTSRFHHPQEQMSMLPVRFPMDSVEDQIQDLLLHAHNSATGQDNTLRTARLSRLYKRLKAGARRGLEKVKRVVRRS